MVNINYNKYKLLKNDIILFIFKNDLLIYKKVPPIHQ